MKKNSFNILRLTALILAIALVLSGCGLAAKNLAKQTLDVTKKMAEYQEKAADVEEKVAALSPRDRRAYQEELARLGFEPPDWLFDDAEALASGAPEETEDERGGGILGFIGGLFGGSNRNSRNSGAEPTEAEIQAALEALQQMAGGTASSPAPATTTPATSTAPATIPTQSATPTTASGNLDTWTRVVDSTFDISEIMAIAWGNNRFVAVGGNGKIAYSTNNGVSWTAVADSGFGQSNIRSIAYGTAGNAGGRFVVASDGGRMAYSADGTSWTRVTDSTFGNSSIRAIAYGGNRWVAGGYSGKMAYSEDGISWTAVENSTFGRDNILAIAYGNNRWVAVGQNGKMAYSSDGSTWTAVADTTFGTNGQIHSIAWGNNRWVAGSYGGQVSYSSDGITWTISTRNLIPSERTFNGVEAITFANGRFVAACGIMAYSTDGVSWTAVADTGFGRSTKINGIAYGNGRFVAVEWSGRMAYADW